MTAESPRFINILIVEDSPTDILMAREALSQAKLYNRLHVVEDGVEALAFLRREGRYADVPRPDVIMLDLNLPRLSGQEVLAAVKADADLKTIPVVVLTTSRAEVDVYRAYGLHANCYVVKPLDFPAFVEVVRSIRHFWFSVVTLPPEAPHGQTPHPTAAG